MKSMAIFCMLVAAVAAGSYGYGQQRLVEEFPQVTRVIESSRPTLVREEVRVAEPVAYGQQRIVEEVPQVTRVIESSRPALVREDIRVAEHLPYGQQRFVEEVPQVTRVIESRRPTLVREEVRVAEHLPYGQQRIVEEVPQVTRVIESSRPTLVREDIRVAEHLPYGQQRFVEEVPQVTRVIESPPTFVRQEVRVAEPLPLRLESPYEHRLAFDAIKKDIPIRTFNHEINLGSDAYSFDFEGANGISSQESGFVKAIPSRRVISHDSNYGYGQAAVAVEEVEGAGAVKSGTTSWCDPEGNFYTLTYTADENGYRPTYTKGACTVPAAVVGVREFVPTEHIAQPY